MFSLLADPYINLSTLQEKMSSIEDTGMKYISNEAPEQLLSGENWGVAWGICFEFSVWAGSDLLSKMGFTSSCHCRRCWQIFLYEIPGSLKRIRDNGCISFSTCLSVIYDGPDTNLDMEDERMNDTGKDPTFQKLIFYMRPTKNRWIDKYMTCHAVVIAMKKNKDA